jgi:hypothetical protein
MFLPLLEFLFMILAVSSNKHFSFHVSTVFGPHQLLTISVSVFIFRIYLLVSASAKK